MIEFGPNLKIDKKPEEVRIDIPMEVVPARGVIEANVGAQEIGLITVDRTHLRNIRDLGLEVEGMGVGTMAQGHLHATQKAILTIMQELTNKIPGAKTIQELKTIGYTLGYLTDKMAKATSVSKSVAEMSGAPVSANEIQNTKQSWTPGAMVGPNTVVNAAPGSNIQFVAKT